MEGLDKEIGGMLNKRGDVHGPFEQQAAVCERLTRVMEDTLNWPLLSDSQRNAIKMIFCKMSRIGWGVPHYMDHWLDVAGYAKLGVIATGNMTDGPQMAEAMPTNAKGSVDRQYRG